MSFPILFDVYFPFFLYGLMMQCNPWLILEIFYLCFGLLDLYRSVCLLFKCFECPPCSHVWVFVISRINELRARPQERLSSLVSFFHSNDFVSILLLPLPLLSYQSYCSPTHPSSIDGSGVSSVPSHHHYLMVWTLKCGCISLVISWAAVSGGSKRCIKHLILRMVQCVTKPVGDWNLITWMSD